MRRWRPVVIVGAALMAVLLFVGGFLSFLGLGEAPEEDEDAFWQGMLDDFDWENFPWDTFPFEDLEDFPWENLPWDDLPEDFDWNNVPWEDLPEDFPWGEIPWEDPPEDFPWDRVPWGELPWDEVPWDNLPEELPWNELNWDEVPDDLPWEKIPWNELPEDFPWENLPWENTPWGDLPADFPWGNVPWQDVPMDDLPEDFPWENVPWNDMPEDFDWNSVPWQDAPWDELPEDFPWENIPWESLPKDETPEDFPWDKVPWEEMPEDYDWNNVPWESAPWDDLPENFPWENVPWEDMPEDTPWQDIPWEQAPPETWEDFPWNDLPEDFPWGDMPWADIPPSDVPEDAFPEDFYPEVWDHEHQFASDVWDVVKEPTCGEKGVKENTCSICKKKIQAEIEATGLHEFGGGNICTVCGCRHIWLQSESKREQYSGKPLVGDAVPELLPASASLLPGHRINAEGLIFMEYRELGKFANLFSFAGGVAIVDEAGNDVTYMYKCEMVYGSLELTKRDVTLRTASKTKRYDGTPLSGDEGKEDDFTAEGLIEGDRFVDVVFGEGQTEYGSRSNEILSFRIVNEAGEDVTGNYSVKMVFGKLRVTP